MTRNQKTYRQNMRMQICDSMLALLEDNPYSDIDVKDICEHAFISRQTFYRYFENKDNVARWKMKAIMQEGSCQIGRKWTWQEGFYVTLMGIYQARALYASEQSLAFSTAFTDFGGQMQRDAFIETLTRYKGIRATEELLFEIEALDAAEAHMVRKWSIEGMTLDPKTLSQYMANIVPYNLFHLLNEPTEKRRPS